MPGNYFFKEPPFKKINLFEKQQKDFLKVKQAKF